MTDLDQMTKGIRERERLRPQRKINYAVKRAVEFTCQHEDCSVDEAVLVVKVDGELTTRCRKHLEGEIQPGQWNERGPYPAGDPLQPAG